MVHHPDKGGSPRVFQALNKAYQVVSDEEQRSLYDTCLKNQTFYVEKYGHFYLQQYYPKSNTLLVILFLLLVFSIMGPVIQHSKYTHACAYLRTAAVKGWGLHEGGSRETLEIRRRALERLRDQGKGGNGNGGAEGEGKVAATVSAAGGGGKGKKKNKGGGPGGAGGGGGKQGGRGGGGSGGGKGEEKVDPDFEAAVRAIVSEMEIRGGHREWEWDDMLVVKLFRLPAFLGASVLFQTRWYVNHTLRGQPFSEEEEAYLAARMVGPGRWESLEEEEKTELVQARIWEDKEWSFGDWVEERELQKMPPKMRKNYLRQKRRMANDGPGDLVSD